MHSQHVYNNHFKIKILIYQAATLQRKLKLLSRRRMTTLQQQEEDSEDDLPPSRSFYQTTKMESLNYNMIH